MDRLPVSRFRRGGQLRKAEEWQDDAPARDNVMGEAPCWQSSLVWGESITRTRSLPRCDNRHARIFALYEDHRGNFPELPEITVDELLATPTEAYTLVDVRTEDEQNVSMIPGSQTLEQFQQAASVNAGKTIVLYCTVGYRSGLEARHLMNAGHNVRNLHGGILVWCGAGQNLVSNGMPTHQVHVYGRRWNLLPDKYPAVW